MYITKIKITNFKCFKETFTLDLNKGLNIIVGNNETGKSTILEAIHLTLTGQSNGRYIKNDLSEYLFNSQSVSEYLESLNTTKHKEPPEIVIEIFISGDDVAVFEGDGGSEKKACGFVLKITLDEDYREDYNLFVIEGGITALPIEFYKITWNTFARDLISTRFIPIKSALIDSTSNRFQNGSDIYITDIIRNHLGNKEKNGLAQAHRKLQANFATDTSVTAVNKIIEGISKKSSKDKMVNISVDLSTKNAWENSILTYVDNIPFQHIGKGEQAIIKTKLALEHKKAKEANIILLEEPENHLSHTRLNYLVHDIHDKCSEKQILITTHSSFVANKLGLDKLILLANKKTTRLNNLSKPTWQFFEKIPGYDTLRLLLCKKAILVEGDADELVVQKAYQKNNVNRLPIEDEIDVISVGMTFLRFLEIAEKIEKPVVVVTDSDGDIAKIQKKYEQYLGAKSKDYIKICYDGEIDRGDLKIGDKFFNYNTLEPKFLKVNGIKKTNLILGFKEDEKTEDELHQYMLSNKTDVALKIFDCLEDIKFPEYILSAIK